MLTIYAYPALFEAGETPGVVVVSFPDIPEAVTEADDVGTARLMAVDALGLALLAYAETGRARPIPTPGAGEPIPVDPGVAAKLAVIESFARAGLSRRAFAAMLGKDEREVRRILDPRHATKLPTLTAALAALGRRLVVGVEELQPAA
jgi:antitoxin HicB